MKHFLKAAFKITWLQVSVILIFATARYWISYYDLADQLLTPVLIIAGIAFVLLLTALGIIGIIENRGISYSSWQERNAYSKKHGWLTNFVAWGQLIPMIVAYALLAYLFAPATWIQLFGLLCVLVTINIIKFFSKKTPN